MQLGLWTGFVVLEKSNDLAVALCDEEAGGRVFLALLDRLEDRPVGVPLPGGPRVVGWINQTLVLTNERQSPDQADRVRISRDCATDPRHAAMFSERT
jgi:hypothetical protein